MGGVRWGGIGVSRLVMVSVDGWGEVEWDKWGVVVQGGHMVRTFQVLWPMLPADWLFILLRCSGMQYMQSELTLRKQKTFGWRDYAQSEQMSRKRHS